MTIAEKVAYIKGLAEGSKISSESKEGKVLTAIIDVLEDIALIATVGRRMSLRSGVAARLFTALAEAKVNIRMIDQGSSEMNIIVGVENKDFEKAVRAIYNAFSEEE